MEPILQAEGLSYFYGEKSEKPFKALDNITMSVNKGEFVTIIGENGSGKSTLAKHFNALFIPSKGRVIVDGLDTAKKENIWKIRQKAGMVFQNPDNQIVATTVEEDIAFGPENLGIPSEEIKARIEKASNSVGLKGFLGHAPHRLSGGQKQRLAIAGIIAMKPDILILDEPTAMLDPRGKREVLDTIKYLNQEENITVVNITHFMDEAMECDRALVMNQGEVVLDGKPGEIFKKVDNVKEYGLEVPQIIELSHLLKQDGISLPADILDINSMVKAIC